jgi:hypothetical protein
MKPRKSFVFNFTYLSLSLVILNQLHYLMTVIFSIISEEAFEGVFSQGFGILNKDAILK